MGSCCSTIPDAEKTGTAPTKGRHQAEVESKIDSSIASETLTRILLAGYLISRSLLLPRGAFLLAKSCQDSELFHELQLSEDLTKHGYQFIASSPILDPADEFFNSGLGHEEWERFTPSWMICASESNPRKVYLVIKPCLSITEHTQASRMKPTPLKIDNISAPNVSVHTGFLHLALEIWEEIKIDFVKLLIQKPHMELEIIGMAESGAIACLLASFFPLTKSFPTISVSVTSFGAPAVFHIGDANNNNNSHSQHTQTQQQQQQQEFKFSLYDNVNAVNVVCESDLIPHAIGHPDPASIVGILEGHLGALGYDYTTLRTPQFSRYRIICDLIYVQQSTNQITHDPSPSSSLSLRYVEKKDAKTLSELLYGNVRKCLKRSPIEHLSVLKSIASMLEQRDIRKCSRQEIDLIHAMLRRDSATDLERSIEDLLLHGSWRLPVGESTVDLNRHLIQQLLSEDLSSLTPKVSSIFQEIFNRYAAIVTVNGNEADSGKRERTLSPIALQRIMELTRQLPLTAITSRYFAPLPVPTGSGSSRQLVSVERSLTFKEFGSLLIQFVLCDPREVLCLMKSHGFEDFVEKELKHPETKNVIKMVPLSRSISDSHEEEREIVEEREKDSVSVPYKDAPMLFNISTESTSDRLQVLTAVTEDALAEIFCRFAKRSYDNSCIPCPGWSVQECIQFMENIFPTLYLLESRQHFLDRVRTALYHLSSQYKNFVSPENGLITATGFKILCTYISAHTDVSEGFLMNLFRSVNYTSKLICEKWDMSVFLRNRHWYGYMVVNDRGIQNIETFLEISLSENHEFVISNDELDFELVGKVTAETGEIHLTKRSDEEVIEVVEGYWRGGALFNKLNQVMIWVMPKP